MGFEFSSAVCAFSLAFCGSLVSVHPALAQAQSTSPPPLAGAACA